MYQNWSGNKNLAKNHQIWTLRFLPFPIFKSLARSTELFGRLLKNLSGNQKRKPNAKTFIALTLKTQQLDPQNRLTKFGKLSKF